MIEIKWDIYLKQLISKMHNGWIKIITGIRLCGKSHLLSHLFKDYFSLTALTTIKSLRSHWTNGVVDTYVENLIDVLSSAVGSLTNPSKLANTLNTVNHAGTTDITVKKYLDILEDAFLSRKVKRYDVKGKSYMDSPVKYYSEDVGLRNARLNFRQIEETHLMENIIYNELILRGYSVDVGVVKFAEKENGKKTEKQHEIDFVVNSGDRKLYIQSAFSIADEEKRQQEITPAEKRRFLQKDSHCRRKS